MGIKMKKILLTLAMATLTSACADRVDNHGHVIKEAQIESLKIGISTKRDVLTTLGTPSTLAPFNDNTWYYVSERVITKSMDRKVLDARQIIIFKFNDKERISSIEFKSKDDGRHVTQSERATKTQGEKLGVVDQMIDNLGKGL